MPPSLTLDPTEAVPSRRLLLQGIAATGVATGLASFPLEDAEAAAALPPTVQLLSAPDRHLVSRFSYGITPGLADDVRRAGGGRAWFEQQLTPARVPDRAANDLVNWWPSLRRGAADLWQRQQNDIEGGWQVMESYQRWSLLRRILSNRQLHEVMTEFWLHHLNVPANGDATFTYRTSYDLVVRDHALGRFEDLLHAAITHPAMGIYLNNAVSTKSHPNENLGRELLELHTVGRGQLRGGRRQELGPHPHRLGRGHVAHLGGVVPPGQALDRPGAGDGLQRRQRRPRRPRPHPALPLLPRPPPGHRPADRAQARREVRAGRRARRAGGAPGAGLPRQRDRHQRRAPRAGEHRGVQERGRRQGARPGRGRRRDLPGAGRHAASSARGQRRAQLRGERRAVADQLAGAAALRVAAARRAAPRQRLLVLALAADGRDGGALGDVRRLVAPGRRRLPVARCSGSLPRSTGPSA